MNHYNRKIARERLHKFFNSSLNLIRNSFSGLTLDGIVIALGGDLLSGEIHSELRGLVGFDVETVMIEVGIAHNTCFG